MIRKQIFFLFLCAAHCSCAQPEKGRVFFDSVVVYTPEYRAFEIKRTEYFQPYIDTLKHLEKKLLDHYMLDPYNEDSITLSNWNKQILQYEKNVDDYFDLVNTISVHYFEQNSPSKREALRRYLDEFCLKNNLDAKSIQIVAAPCTNGIDYTKEMIIFLKEEYD